MLKLIDAVEQSQNYSLEEIVDIIKKNPNSVFETDLVEGYTALHYAAWDGKDQIVSILIENGAKVDAKGIDEYTPFLLAANNNHLKSTEILVNNGADINIIIDDDNYLRGASGINAIRTVALNQYWEMFDYLIDKNADINLLTEPCITPNGGYTNLIDVIRHLGLTTSSVNHNEERLKEFENLLKNKNLYKESSLENDVNEEDQDENKGYPLILRSNKKNENGDIDDELNNRISEYLMNWQCPTESFNGRMGIKAFIPSWIPKIDNNDCCPKFSTNDISFISEIITKEKIIPILRYAPEELYYHTKAIWWVVPFCIWAGDKASWLFIDKNGFYAAYPEDEDVTMVMSWDKIEEMEYSSEDFYTDEEEVHSLNLISESGELTFTEFVPKGRGSFLSVIESIYEVRKETIQASKGLAQWLEGSGGESLKSIEHPSNLLKKESWNDPTRLNLSEFGFSIMESDENLANKHYEKGNEFIEKKLFTEAINEFNKALEKKPSWIEALYFRHHAKFESNDYEGAIEDLTNVINLTNNDAPSTTKAAFFRERGNIYFKLQEYTKSIIDFDKSIELDDDNNKWAYLGRAKSNKELQEYENAIKDYSKVIEIESNNKWAYHERGNIYRLNLNDFNRAIKDFDQVLKIDPEYKWAYQARALAKKGLNEYKNAVSDFDKVIEIDPNYKWAYHERGLTRVQLKEFDNAIEDFNMVIKLDSNYKWAYREKGNILLFLDNIEEAKETYLSAFEVDENYCYASSIALNLALIHQELDEHNEAEQLFKKCKEYAFHKRNLTLHYNEVLNSKKRKPLILEEDHLYEKGENEILEEALINRGKIEHYKPDGDFDDTFSLNDLSKAIEINPKSFKSYFYRAKIYLNGHYKSYHKEKGIVDLETCLEIERYVPALIKLSSLIENESIQEELIYEAIKIEPNNAFAWQTCGDILFKKQKFKKALHAFKESSKLDSDGWILQRIAECYKSLNNKSEAISFYINALDEINWRDDWHFNLATLYFDSSEYTLAEKSIYNAIKLYAYEKYYDLLALILNKKLNSKKYSRLKNSLVEYFSKVNINSNYSYSERVSEIEYLKSYEKHIILEEETLFSIIKFFDEKTLIYLFNNGSNTTIKHLLNNPDLIIPEEFKDLKETNITIHITGNGSEFNQGLITKDDYNKWLKHKEINQNWNDFVMKELKKDGYWDVSEISSFTGFNKDLISINIFINDQEFFSGNYNSLLDKFFEEEGEISQNINVSENYGKWIFPKDGEWNTFFDKENFEKRNKKLVTTITSEQFDISTEIKTFKNFSINKLGFVFISTDELGYGKDFGDFIRDIKYDEIELDIEFPGGVGDISEINIS